MNTGQGEEEARFVAGSLSRILSRLHRAAEPRGLAPDDHFSGAPVSRHLERPTRESMTDRADPYAASGQEGRRRKAVSRQPTDSAFLCRVAPLFGLAPGGVCRARPVTRPAGELFPHRFTLTSKPARREPRRFRGGLFSVALSLSKPRDMAPTVGVTHHRTLWSPDFPPRHVPKPAHIPGRSLVRSHRHNLGATAIIAPATNTRPIIRGTPSVDKQACLPVDSPLQLDVARDKRFIGN